MRQRSPQDESLGSHLAPNETESDIIRSLNFDFATIRDKKDLLKIIHYKLKGLLDFANHFVMTINDDEVTMTSFLLDTGSETKEHPKYKKVISAKYLLSDRIMSKALLSQEPLVFDLGQEALQGNLPGYLQILFENGIKKVVMNTLQVRERTIGIWAICLMEGQQMIPRQLHLVKDVSYQISIAVSNILANEEIVRRDSERELLLSLSIDIAAARNNDELLRVITNRLKTLLGFSHMAIGLINDDRKTFSAFLLDPDSESKDHPVYSCTVHDNLPIDDGVMDKVAARPEPVVFCLHTLSQNQEMPVYLRLNFESGIRQAVIVRFSKGPEILGFWMIFFDREVNMVKSRLSLIEGLSNQLSVAISNVISNEKINQQLREIKKYKQQLEEEKIYLKEELETTHNCSEIIGNSPEVRKVFRLVTQVASSDSTVLILGETGTGKELVARAIHNNSPRKDQLMVKVNCAALPANLIESELFGHERGSFTGAVERRIGKFELANKGTLFLDEIGEMPMELQVKLLRALQEKEIERVGGKNTIKVDVRIIAATNRDLETEMAEGRFRQDLYYRLNIFPIALPPLRQRREDIPLLASYFILRFAKKTGKKIDTFSNKVLEELMLYNWPGNIRELEHLIERSVILTSGDTIKHVELPSAKPAAGRQGLPDQIALKTIDENEREHILGMLKYCRGRIAGEGGAAQILGVPSSTLHSKIKRLGIRREHLV